MTNKNFKNLGANPVQVTLAPGEFNNNLQTNIPRQKLPYNYYLGSIKETATRSVRDGDRVYFEVTDQISEQNLINVSQIAADGSIPAYTLFTLKPGHMYKLVSQVYETGSNEIDEFAWFRNSDVTPGTAPSATNILGRSGKEIELASLNAHFLTPAVAYLDLSNSVEAENVVVAFKAGNTNNKSLTNSTVEITNITDKSGPWS